MSDVTLKRWGAFALLVPDLGEPTLHVVGLNVRSRRGRVSSPVVKVHVTGRRLITRSGRTYDLSGAPGAQQDCLAILSSWATTWNASMLADLTEVLSALAARSTALH